MLQLRPNTVKEKKKKIIKDKPEGSSKRAGLQKALVKEAKYFRWLREWPGLSLLN